MEFGKTAYGVPVSRQIFLRHSRIRNDRFLAHFPVPKLPSFRLLLIRSRTSAVGLCFQFHPFIVEFVCRTSLS